MSTSIFWIISLFLSFWQTPIAILSYVSSIKREICRNLRLAYLVSSHNFSEGYGSVCPKIGHSVESINLLLRSCLFHFNLHAQTHILKKKVENSIFGFLSPENFYKS